MQDASVQTTKDESFQNMSYTTPNITECCYDDKNKVYVYTVSNPNVDIVSKTEKACQTTHWDYKMIVVRMNETWKGLEDLFG